MQMCNNFVKHAGEHPQLHLHVNGPQVMAKWRAIYRTV